MKLSYARLLRKQMTKYQADKNLQSWKELKQTLQDENKKFISNKIM